MWLKSLGCDAQPDGPRTLSELYAIRSGAKPVSTERTIGFRSTNLHLDDDEAHVIGFSSNGRARE